MWERVVASGALVIGAFVLFGVFMGALFMLERKPKKQPVRLRVIRCEKNDRAA